MALKHLQTYLNDHLSGSVVALELIEHLKKAPLEQEFRDLLQLLDVEIRVDRAQLESIMRQLGLEASTPRKWLAWISEKMLQLKLKMDDTAEGSLGLLEALEVLSLGIEGKKELWLALAQVLKGITTFADFNWTYFEHRAVHQRQQLEPFRLRAAQAALAIG